MDQAIAFRTFAASASIWSSHRGPSFTSSSAPAISASSQKYVRVAQLGLVVRVELGGPLDRVPADRVEHRDPRRPGVIAPDDERLRHQRLDQREHVAPG